MRCSRGHRLLRANRVERCTTNARNYVEDQGRRRKLPEVPTARSTTAASGHRHHGLHSCRHQPFIDPDHLHHRAEHVLQNKLYTKGNPYSTSGSLTIALVDPGANSPGHRFSQEHQELQPISHRSIAVQIRDTMRRFCHQGVVWRDYHSSVRGGREGNGIFF